MPGEPTRCPLLKTHHTINPHFSQVQEKESPFRVSLGSTHREKPSLSTLYSR